MNSSNGSQNYDIQWNDYSRVIQQGFRINLKDQKFVDVTLACEGGSIKCHRMVLSACSSYFANLFTQYPEEHHLVIFLKDTQHWIIESLLYFMYNGKITIERGHLAVLLQSAKSLKIKGLSSESIEGLVDSQNDYFDYLRKQSMQSQNTQRKQGDPNANGASVIPGREKNTARKNSVLKNDASLRRRSSSSPIMIKPVTKKRSLDSTYPSCSSGSLESAKKRKTDADENEPVVAGASICKTSVNNLKLKPVKLESETIKSQFSPFLLTLKPVEDHVGAMDFDVDKSKHNEHAFPFRKSVDTTSTLIYDSKKERNGSASSGPDNPSHIGDDMSGSGSELQDKIDALTSAKNINEIGIKEPKGRLGGPYRHSKEIRESVLSTLKSGRSVSECSKLFNIPISTIAKWRQRENEEVKVQQMEILQNAVIDREERLRKAAEVCVTGIPMSVAAARYGVPSSTLFAYTMRQGLCQSPYRLTSTPLFNPIAINSGNATTNFDASLRSISSIMDNIANEYKFPEEENKKKSEENHSADA